MKSVVFQDYILTLSVLCRGTIDEKLRWIFRLYDINGEGQLTREVIEEFRINVIYELLFFF
jgi:Ca2+-binding EF-hand superfamily protein